MKNTDEKILELLCKEAEKSAETANVPLRLQKESIVAMLKNEQLKKDENKDFSDKTGRETEASDSKKKKSRIYRFTAVAAMLILVFAGVLSMNNREVYKFKSLAVAQQKNNLSVNQIKKPSDDSELEKAIIAIIDKNSAQQNTNTPSTTKADITNIQQTVAANPSEGNSATNKQTADSAVPVPDISQGSAIDRYKGFVAVNEEDFSQVQAFDTDRFSLDADIVKQEGNYLYVVSLAANQETGGIIEEIKTVRVSPADSMAVVSSISLSEYSSEHTTDRCIEIHVKDGKLIAMISRVYTATSTASTVAVYYDISDPENPVKVREHIQDGEYVFSGIQGENLCLVTDKSIKGASDKASMIPSFTVDGKKIELDSNSEISIANDPDTSYLFITVTDISDFSNPVGRMAVIGGGKRFCCTSDAVVFAREFVSSEADDNGNRAVKTEISRFNISGTTISSGSYNFVDGALIGGISADEESGFLRAVTAVGDSVNISVFNDKMQYVSAHSTKLAGEKAVGSRFVGKNGYIILSGENGVKTMVVDLSKPENPKFAGEITSDGFADNLFMVSDNLILGVKAEETEVSLTLYDVSKPDSPKVADSCTLGEEYTFRTDDLNGIIVMQGKNKFGLPVSLNDKETGEISSAYLVFDVSGGEFGKVEHLIHSNDIGSTASRGACIGEMIYTVSGDKIMAFDSNSFSAVSQIDIM